LSSILRALKKLENEPRHLEEPQTPGSKFVPSADTAARKTPVGIIMMIIGGGIVCGVVILAGWWIFSVKTPPSAVAPEKISQQGLQQAEVVPGTAKEEKKPENSSGSVGPVKPAADIAAPLDTAAQVPGATLIKTPQPSSPAIVQRPAMPVDEPAPGPALPEPAAPGPEIIQVPAEKITVAATRPPEVSAKVKEIEIPALSDPEMKLQAITWSKDPQKRIVVINNRILRQGEAVYGYRIDTINQDDVVLNDAGKKWKLIFRIK
jgi:hypothetical protein